MLALLVAVVVFGFSEGAANLWGRWMRDPTYGHGILLFPLTLVLIWRSQRATTVSSADRPSLILAVCIFLGIALGQMLGILAAFQFGLPLGILAVLVFLYGRQSLESLWFPVLFLYFSIPVWDIINPMLQSLTTLAVGQLLYLVRLPAFIVGNQVEVANGVFEIAAGCSGLRFFIITTALAALYGDWYLEGWRSKLTVLVAGIVLSIIGNWLRVFMVIQMGVHLGLDHPQVADHRFVGWLVFVVTVAIMLWFARYLKQRDEGNAVPQAQPTPQLSVIALGACALLAVHGGSALTQHLLVRDAQSLSASIDGPDYLRVDACGLWRNGFVGADFEARGTIRHGEGVLCVDTVWYAQQQQGAEVTNPANRAFAGTRFERVRGVPRFNTRGDELVVGRTETGEGVWVAIRRYIGEQPTESALDTLWLQLKSLLAGRLDARALLVTQRCDVQCRQRLIGGDSPLDISEALDAAEQKTELRGVSVR